jgi:hypothetical protein
MKKLLYIAPHLSTGGLPQYLTKKIELLKDEFEIYLVEWVDCTGGVLVVTRNKIVKLIDSDKFFTLGDNKQELINIISKIKPDIIHLEEIPECFMDSDITKQIYNPNREYIIVETSHDSSYDVSNKQFFPDKFMFVSQWQIDQYKSIDVPSVLIEYPIEYIERPDRDEALRNLHLDPTKKHILHVGLYTSRKNQAEFFEYAKAFPEYEFHSLGNRADNFKWYWGPLEQNTPPNLTWWNERTDVDAFYQAMDLFLFTSRGTNNDKETMPLVIREAISNQIPTLIYNLEVYQNYFDKFEKVNYLKFDDFKQNCTKIQNILEPKQNIDKEIFVISTYPNTKSVIETTKECIRAVKQTGRKVILTSHIPIPEELSIEADYSINDNNNILTKHTYYSNSWIQTPEYKAHINLKGEDNDIYHGPACYSNYYNGVALAKNLGFDKVYLLNYDYILKDSKYIDDISNILNNKDAFFGLDEALEGKQIVTWFVAFKPDLFLDLPKIETAQDYDNLMSLWGAESNSYENMLYHAFKNTSNVYWGSKEEFYKNIQETFTHKDYSRVEYFTVLPSNRENEIVPFMQISNNNDSREIEYTLYKNNVFEKKQYYTITSKFQAYDIIPFSAKDEIRITYDIFDLKTNTFLEQKEFIVNDDYINNKLKNNGLFEWL